MEMKISYDKRIIEDGYEICLNENVYNPSDDTYLVIDYIKLNREHFTGKKVIDIGCGSGALSLYALRNGASHVLAIDINPYAVYATKCTLEANGINDYDIIRCDKLSCLRNNVTFDIALFNPPYLPEDMKNCENWIELSWCGGNDGSQVIIETLESLKDINIEKIVMVISSLTSHEKTIEKLREYFSYVKVANSKRFFFEELNLVVGERHG